MHRQAFQPGQGTLLALLSVGHDEDDDCEDHDNDDDALSAQSGCLPSNDYVYDYDDHDMTAMIMMHFALMDGHNDDHDDHECVDRHVQIMMMVRVSS